LEQVRLTTIEMLTGLTFPALRAFDPLLFHTMQPASAMTTSHARAIVRERLLSGSDGAEVVLDEFGEDVISRATRPGTASITNVRDIVL